MCQPLNLFAASERLCKVVQHYRNVRQSIVQGRYSNLLQHCAGTPHARYTSTPVIKLNIQYPQDRPEYFIITVSRIIRRPRQPQNSRAQ